MIKRISKTLVLFSLLALVIMASCTKDAEDLIVGKWQCTYSYSIDYSYGFVYNTGVFGKMVEFTKDGYVYVDEVLDSKYSVGKECLFFNALGYDSEFDGEYVIDTLMDAKLTYSKIYGSGTNETGKDIYGFRRL